MKRKRKGQNPLIFRRKSNVGRCSLTKFIHLRNRCAMNTVIFFVPKILAHEDKSNWGFGGWLPFGQSKNKQKAKEYWA